MEAEKEQALKTRILVIDILRGLVMVIMAIDHVRDFWNPGPIRPEDVAQASIGLFFTRWVTHLCAPTFVFLSGISIYLYQQQKQNLKQTSVFLLTRGLWLIAIEVLIISPLITHGYGVILLLVFWVIGASMILMALLIRLPRKVLLVLAILLIAGHNLLPFIQPVTNKNLILAIFHNSPFFIAGTPSFLMTYTIVPWVAVMMLGYCLGEWFNRSETEMRSLFLKTGIALLAVFLLLRFINIYGDPVPWSEQTRGWIYTVLSFLNVSKYPASLLFLSVILGISMILLSIIGNRDNTVTRILMVYGRVPFFYFILHFLFLSISSVLWGIIAFDTYVNFAFTQPDALPAQYETSLLRTYFVWILILMATYFPCRWFSEYKRKNKKWWLSYL